MNFYVLCRLPAHCQKSCYYCLKYHFVFDLELIEYSAINLINHKIMQCYLNKHELKKYIYLFISDINGINIDLKHFTKRTIKFQLLSLPFLFCFLRFLHHS